MKQMRSNLSPALPHPRRGVRPLQRGMSYEYYERMAALEERQQAQQRKTPQLSAHLQGSDVERFGGVIGENPELDGASGRGQRRVRRVRRARRAVVGRGAEADDGGEEAPAAEPVLSFERVAHTRKLMRVYY